MVAALGPAGPWRRSRRRRAPTRGRRGGEAARLASSFTSQKENLQQTKNKSRDRPGPSLLPLRLGHAMPWRLRCGPEGCPKGRVAAARRRKVGRSVGANWWCNVVVDGWRRPGVGCVRRVRNHPLDVSHGPTAPHLCCWVKWRWERAQIRHHDPRTTGQVGCALNRPAFCRLRSVIMPLEWEHCRGSCHRLGSLNCTAVYSSP